MSSKSSEIVLGHTQVDDDSRPGSALSASTDQEGELIRRLTNMETHLREAEERQTALLQQLLDQGHVGRPIGGPPSDLTLGNRCTSIVEGAAAIGTTANDPGATSRLHPNPLEPSSLSCPPAGLVPQLNPRRPTTDWVTMSEWEPVGRLELGGRSLTM